ncbi:MAG: T9SS type A sorting domain-containing protein [Bacteroidota bacterium]
MRYLLLFSIAFCLITSVFAQNSGWSAPVPIDSTRDFVYPLIAVSPKGQIATLSFGSLYTSNDNGKSFQYRYEFTPPLTPYWMFTPNGLAYDSNSVLWVYWAWDWCTDEVCTFTKERYLYLSRSTDGGKTFEHVLQFPGAFLIATNGPHPATMVIGKDNTIHFLRDSAWFNGNFTEHYLIYSKIPQGDLAQRTEVMLPKVPDSLEIESGVHFILPNDNKPVSVFRANIRANSKSHYLVTKFQSNGSFAEYKLLDSLKSGVGIAKVNLVTLQPNKVQLSYWQIKYEPEEKFYYFIMSSDNGGDTLGLPIATSEEVFNINHTDDQYFYAINYSFRKQRAMYYQFTDIFSPPVDSADLGFSSDVYSCVDNNGGKYVLFTNAENKTYFIGKDIVTSIRWKMKNEREKTDVQVSVSPNPFNNSVTITFILPREGKVSIDLYDINGRRVKEMRDYSAYSGKNRIQFIEEKLSSGTYVVALHYNNATYTAKALLIK